MVAGSLLVSHIGGLKMTVEWQIDTTTGLVERSDLSCTEVKVVSSFPKFGHHSSETIGIVTGCTYT